MDLNYFETIIPVTSEIVDIVIASGWALLLGNLVFQATKSMLSGLGFEGEDPKTLFARTFVFGFLLLASRQVCEIGIGISGALINLLQIPSSVTVTLPDENVFSIGASWLLVVIVGIVLMWQVVKLFFEIGERYFLVGFLTITAPWAFAMGGSKNTADIFKGWARMYGSMCLMMVLNVIFLKMLLSAMGYMPSGAGVLPWMIFVVAIARVARKIDNVVARIGLNPAQTGDGLGRSFPGMLSYLVVRSVASSITKTAAANSAGKVRASSAILPPPGTSTASNGGPSSHSNVHNQSAAQNSSHTQAASNSTTRQNDNRPGTAGTGAQGYSGTPATAKASGTAGTGIQGYSLAPATAKASGTAGTPPGAAAQGQNGSHQFFAGNNGTAGTERSSAHQSTAQANSSRRSSVMNSTHGGVNRPGMAGRAPAPGGAVGEAKAQHPPISPVRQQGQSSLLCAGTAGNERPHSDGQPPKSSRYSHVPPGTRESLGKSTAPGAAGTANLSNNTRVQHGGAAMGVQNQSSASAQQANSQHNYHGAMAPTASAQPRTANGPAPASNAKAPGFGTRGTSGAETRRSAAAEKTPASVTRASETTAAGHSFNRPDSSEPRHGRNIAPVTPPATASSPNTPAPQAGGTPISAESPSTMRQPPDTAGRGQQNSNTSDAKKQFSPYKPGAVGQGTTRINSINGAPGKSAGGKGGRKKTRRRKGGETDEQ